METNLVYFDETGDDGLIKTSSETFILTSICMSSENWQKNFNQMRFVRQQLKDKYGFHIKEEMHTKYFLTDKDPYRKYKYVTLFRILCICIINVVLRKMNYLKELQM